MSDEHTPWTTVNFAEALPGVQTPLGWTFWADASERAARLNFARLGVLPVREIGVVPRAPDERFCSVFYGRVAGNVARLREMADGIPGTSGDAAEELIFGSKQSGLSSKQRWARYPVAGVKAPVSMMQARSEIRRLRTSTQTWWSGCVNHSPADLSAARATLAEARRRFEVVMGWHGLITMAAQGLYDRVTKVALQVDELPVSLVAGYGSTDEVGLLDDLWRVSQGDTSLAEFLGKHGYHGPREGELSSRSWREDGQPVLELLPFYTALEQSVAPGAVECAQRSRRREAERDFLGRLPPLRRPGAKAVFRLAATFIPLRETGKAAYLQTFDVARLAARVAGQALVASGDLESVEQVFQLTVDELLEGRVPARSEIAARIELRRYYLGVRLPKTWIGQPQPMPAEATSPGHPTQPAETTVVGIGVSDGTVEGRVCVISDPAVVQMTPGDVLVCETTDPSWAGVMFVAGAIVADVGGAVSHAAIVARELGLPCVVNTGDGTRRLRTGDLVRVNGREGTVTVLVPNEPPIAP